MSLYRKYRPKDFPSLVGQDHIKITLLNAIKAGKISHAYLFTGPRGTGKTSTARLLAKAINVETMTEDGRFEGSELAEEIDQGRLIDVIEIDAASNRGIDEIRDLREKINYSPTRAKNKVYIIDEVHMLTKEAFNALLKTLEEPPSFVFFILATTEIHKVPDTIISRCQRFDFRRITEVDLLSRLREVAVAEGVGVEEEGMKIIARQARGGLRDALSLFEQLISGGKLETERVKRVLGISNFTACEELFDLLDRHEAAGGVEKLTTVFEGGGDLVQFNRDFLDYLRRKMLDAVREGKIEQTARIVELIGYFQESYEKQKFSYIPELPLEVAIVKACLGRQIEVNSDQLADQSLSKKKPELEKMAQIPANRAAVAEQKAGVAEMAAQVEPRIAVAREGEISLEELMKSWNKVFERIHNPLAKRCLMSGKPVETGDGKITLAFSSNFNKDKLFVAELLSVSEKAIADEYGQNLKLVGKVDTNLVVSFGAAYSAPAAPSSPVQSTETKESLMASAMSVFGGEVAV